MKSFHIPLPDPDYNRLKKISKGTKTLAIKIAHSATISLLKEQEQLAVHDSITAFAHSYGGTTHDLDPLLERASLDSLSKVRL